VRTAGCRHLLARLTLAVIAMSAAMQHPAHAAQTTSARTELVAFDNSPFPYSGQPPGQD
jgi:hypothetical protein